jgi:hypothetical protein
MGFKTGSKLILVIKVSFRGGRFSTDMSPGTPVKVEEATNIGQQTAVFGMFGLPPRRKIRGSF